MTVTGTEPDRSLDQFSNALPAGLNGGWQLSAAVVMAITVGANGDVEFPDGEDLDLWPQNNPDPNQVRRTISYQVLRAMQANLATV